jgi:hypothetical protein
MVRKSITQEYFVLALNEKGNMPALRTNESKAGLAIAGLMDLLLNDIIAVEKKKITVIKDLSDELEHIAPLYTYLKEKPRSIEKLANDYVLSTGSRIKQFTAEQGKSLLADNIVTEGEGGLFGNKTKYIPEKDYKDELIDIIKSALKKDEEMTPHDMAIIFILEETKNSSQYFSKYERDGLKTKLKEIKKNPQNKLIADVVNYISDIAACMVVVMTSINSSINSI